MTNPMNSELSPTEMPDFELFRAEVRNSPTEKIRREIGFHYRELEVHAPDEGDREGLEERIKYLEGIAKEIEAMKDELRRREQQHD